MSQRWDGLPGTRDSFALLRRRGRGDAATLILPGFAAAFPGQVTVSLSTVISDQPTSRAAKIPDHQASQSRTDRSRRLQVFSAVSTPRYDGAKITLARK
jgi:hypothetical protein